jgi:hypothetical protein
MVCTLREVLEVSFDDLPLALVGEAFDPVDVSLDARSRVWTV